MRVGGGDTGSNRLRAVEVRGNHSKRMEWRKMEFY